MVPKGSFAVADLLGLQTPTDQIAYLRDQGLADEPGLGWVLDRAEESVHDDPQTTTGLAGLCRQVARVLELSEIGARAAYLEARVCAEQGDLSRALALIEEAKDLWSRALQPLQAARTDLGRMQILDDLGQHAAALEVGHGLLTELDRLPAKDDDEDLRQWIRAAALENVGVASGYTGDHVRALQAYESAEEAYRVLDMPEETARPRANRGIELFELGRTAEALEVLRSAETAFRTSGDRLWSAKCLGHIANVLEQRGELHEALRILEPARRTLEELGAGVEAVRLRLALARVYLAVGLSAEAGTEAAAANNDAMTLGLLHDAGNARFTAALAEASEGHLDDAQQHVRAASALFTQVGDRQYVARTTLAEADIADAQHRPDDARRLAAEAADALAAGNWLIPLCWAELRLFDNAADSASAAVHLRHATELAAQLRLPQLRHECDLRTARLRRSEGADVEAEDLLRRAVERVEQAGTTLPDPQLRRAFREDRLAAHDELIDLLINRGRASDVLEGLTVADRSKGQTLEELRARTMGVSHLDERFTTRSDLAAESVGLKADLNAAYAGLLTAEPLQAAVLRSRAEDLEHQISALQMRSVVDVASTAAMTPDGGADLGADLPGVAVEFHVLGDDVMVFVVRDGSVEVRRLPGIMPGILTQLSRLTAQWSRFQMGTAFSQRHLAALTDTAREVLAALYALLLGPIESLLSGLGTDRIVIVPHRRLHAVPFHALHDGWNHLVERWTITVSPSLASRRRPRLRVSNDALVLAVPDARAPSVVREAAALAAQLPEARVLVGNDATTEALRSSVSGPGLLHIACHGLYRPSNPLFSSLRLADRWLTAAEALELDLDGAIVTLSACESGRAGGTAEPVGLGWAFLAAGADSVVVSQWVAHDDLTADMMSEMYRHLSTSIAPDVALRRAQSTILSKIPHPYYWAAFTHVAPARGPESEVPHDPGAPP